MIVAGHWRYARGYVRGFVSGLRNAGPENVGPEPASPEPDLEDPEVLLDLARQEMRETQAKNRERAVQAITQKNYLQAEADKTRKLAANLRSKADLAHGCADHDLEKQLLAEAAAYEKTLVGMEKSLVSATETVELIKTAMRREEERIRAKTAQAMALKTQWKERQIFAAIALAADADTEAVLKPLRFEVQAFFRHARRLSDELHVYAEQAIRNGNRDLARALLTERAALQQGFAAS